MRAVWLTILLYVGVSLAEKIRYDDYAVYRLTPKDDEAMEFLRNIENGYPSAYSFWTPVRAVGIPVDIMVPPYLKIAFSEATSNLKMDSQVLMNNVQEQIDNEGFRPGYKAGTFGWTDYHGLDEINSWLATLPLLYPGMVTLINAGETYENRIIYGVKVSFSSANKNNSVFIESNIHAREWITSAVSTFILNELLNSTDLQVRQVAESHDWYFVPVTNPDGFVYTSTSDRLWRKTRVPHSLLCYGADPNRNWGYKWNSGGSSNMACSETYHGPNAFSEPSTASLSAFISLIASDLVAYISFHSYLQLLLLPYGDTTAHLDNYADMLLVGKRAIAALAKRYGTKYVVGNVAETIYVASGSSMDWVKGTFKTPIAFTYELRDNGTNGFILPANQIIPTGLETLDSLVTILVEGKKYINKTRAYNV